MDDFITQIQCEEVYTEDLYGTVRYSDEDEEKELVYSDTEQLFFETANL